MAAEAAAAYPDASPDVAVRAVKMKLNTFMQDRYAPALRTALSSLVVRGNRLLAEAYAFANYHVLRLLANGAGVEDLPLVDHNFYYRCLCAVSNIKCAKSTLSEALCASIAKFDELRPAGKLGNKVDMVGEVQLMASLSRVMATMAQNHLQLNLEGRVAAYFRWRYPALRGLWSAMTRRVVHADAPAVPKPSDPAKAAKARDAEEACRPLRDQLAVLHAARRNLAVAKKARAMLPLYYAILSATDAESLRRQDLPAGAPRLARLRPFSLLPVKQGYTASYIPISTMTMLRVLKVSKLESFKGDGRDEDYSALWRKYFSPGLAETSTASFAWSMLTDGYGVSVLMNGLSSPSVPASPDVLPDKAVPDGARKLAIDPGFTDVVTVVDSSGGTWSYSSAQFYDQAKYNYCRKRIKVWTAQTAEQAKAVPGHATADPVRHGAHVQAYLAALPALLEQRMAQGYRKLRFLRYCQRKRAIMQLCHKIAPLGQTTVVGFGDWKGGAKSCISRRTCGPIRELKQELCRRSDVVFCLLDEYHTSQKCSCCQHRLVNMKADTTKVKQNEDGEVKRVTTRGRVHKVLHCRNSEERSSGRCGKTWNRDVNAAHNLLAVLNALLQGAKRPAYLSRPKPAEAGKTTSRDTGRKGGGQKPMLGVIPNCYPVSPS